jgi:hypothetical protein
MICRDWRLTQFSVKSTHSHTHKLNRKLSPLYSILHYTNPLQNNISSHRTDTIHWNKWLLAPSCPDKYEQLTFMQIFSTQKFITPSCIISNRSSCPYYILLQLFRKANTDCKQNVTSPWLWFGLLDWLTTSFTITHVHNHLQWLISNLQPNPSSSTAEFSLHSRSLLLPPFLPPFLPPALPTSHSSPTDSWVSELHYDRRSVSQSLLVSSPHLRPTTISLFINPGFLDFVHRPEFYN